MNNFLNVYEICKKKFDIHMEKYRELCELRACKHGDYYAESERLDFYHKNNWMTSFVTGLAPLYHKSTGDERYITWANKYAVDYYNKIMNHSMDTMHDLGFLYSAYSVAMYMETGNEEHKKTALKAADELVKRFDINGRYIEAWCRMDWDIKSGRAIIDCMMNIQLLFWAWKETGHRTYKDVAKAHADTTIRYFIREDYSVCHSFLFDKETGAVIGEDNDCGFSNGSHWARGTAWIVYGLAMTAKYLDDNYYYELAVKVADKYIACCKGAYVPVWDFRLPENMPAFECSHADNPEWDITNRENCKYNVDTSAAAIIANAMLILNERRENARIKKFAIKSIEMLCMDYFDNNEKIPGILKAQNGQMTYATFGDYFFVEALQRLLFDFEFCW